MFYEGIKKLKSEINGSSLVTEEDIVNAHLFDSAISVAVYLPKFIDHTSMHLHKSHANSQVHRLNDVITPILNTKNERLPESILRHLKRCMRLPFKLSRSTIGWNIVILCILCIFLSN